MISLSIPNPDGNLESDPILDYTDAKFCSLLRKIHTPDHLVVAIVKDEARNAHRNCNRREDVKEENGSVLVLFLPDQDCSNVDHINDEEKNVERDDQVSEASVND